MEAALVSVSTGVMKPLLSKLTKLLGEEYAKLKGVRKQIKFLRDELSAMSPTLEMLADAEQLDPQMTAWRDKLRELSYDLEDCIDAFMDRVDHERDGGFIKRFFHKLKKLKPRHEIANQIKELKASVMEASERHKRYDLAQLKNKSSSSSVDPRLHALYEDIDKLVGINGPKKHIIELLNMEMDGSSAKLKVVSIVGCGGLGKTTLAKQVYDTIKGQFKCAAFVSVSRTPDVRKILIHIANGVMCTGIITQDDDEQQLIDKLREHLHDKRYIVVIDDVWNTKDWGFIKLALPSNDLGSRIIMTTRSVTVAKCCSSQVYEMRALSYHDSKRLFFRRAFRSENNSCYPHLEDVLEKILRKCYGLPLAIVTVSGILTNQFSKAEWDRVLNAIGSTLAKNPDAENMTAILSMSYFDIPHYLRTCLLYMSMFPEDYEIEKQCLINRWIAEGFIHEKGGQTKYEIGEGYFNDLVNRSMIQPVKVKNGQAEACRVHDIILDYIKWKATEENFVSSLDAAEPAYTSKYKVRRLCVSNHCDDNVNIWEDQILSHVRSVAIFGQPVNLSLLPSTALRVLDLADCSMEHQHLASIEKLFNLKYLRLRSYWITRLPENVGELHHLQTLDVRGTCINELPQSMKKLQQLARLYVDPLAIFPDGIIGQMLSLEELGQYGVFSIEQGLFIQELSKLTKLRTLEVKLYFTSPEDFQGTNEVQGIHNYIGNLLSSCNLHNLYIWNFHENIYPLSLDSWHLAASCSLLKLCIKGSYIYMYKVPNWMGSLENLHVLELMIICLRPEDVEILGEIPTLLFLTLKTSGGTNGRIIVHGNKGFRNLKYFSLHIKACGTLLEFEVGSMPKLEHVKLKLAVHQMDCLNGAPFSMGIQHLSALSKVDIISCGWSNAFTCVSRAIIAAVETLPNHPTVRFDTKSHWLCHHYELNLWLVNERELGGAISEWLEFLQIRKEAYLLFVMKEAELYGESELEDETHEKEEEEQTDEKGAGEETDEEEEEIDEMCRSNN